MLSLQRTFFFKDFFFFWNCTFLEGKGSLTEKCSLTIQFSSDNTNTSNKTSIFLYFFFLWNVLYLCNSKRKNMNSFENHEYVSVHQSLFQHETDWKFKKILLLDFDCFLLSILHVVCSVDTYIQSNFRSDDFLSRKNFYIKFSLQ